MIIVHGSKHYPQDVEEVIRLAHPDIRKGGVAAWATQTKNAGGKFIWLLETIFLIQVGQKDMNTMELIIFDACSAFLFVGLSDVMIEHLVVICELRDKDKDVRAYSSSKSGISKQNISNTNKVGAKSNKSNGNIQLATTLLRKLQVLPLFIRTPLVKCLARVAARYVYSQNSNNSTSTTSNGSNNRANNGVQIDNQDSYTTSLDQSGYDLEELDDIERAIKKEVLKHFGISVGEVILTRPVSVNTASTPHSSFSKCLLKCEPQI